MCTKTQSPAPLAGINLGDDQYSPFAFFSSLAYFNQKTDSLEAERCLWQLVSMAVSTPEFNEMDSFEKQIHTRNMVTLARVARNIPDPLQLDALADALISAKELEETTLETKQHFATGTGKSVVVENPAFPKEENLPVKRCLIVLGELYKTVRDSEVEIFYKSTILTQLTIVIGELDKIKGGEA